MNTPDASDSSEGATWSLLGSRRTEVKYQDTPDISGFSNREQCDTSRGSGSSKKEAWGTLNVSGFRGTELWHTHNVSGDRGTEVLERQCRDTDPRKMTAEGSRYTSDTSQQPSASAYQEQASIMKEMFEMIKEMKNKNTKEMLETMKEMNKNMKEMSEMMKKMDNKIMPIPGRAIQIQHQKDEETEMLKKQIKKLEARNQELLAKAMAMHQDSEDINDPLHLSALLKRYEMLRLHEWEKARSCMAYPMSYEEGSHIIRKLFDVCEKDIQRRKNYILKVLDFPFWNDTLTKVMPQDIMKLFRQLYHQSVNIYNTIIQEAAIHVRTESQEQFLLQCCHIYCLLLLQDPPVKAEWKINRRYSEHMDKKDEVNWEKASFLWPIMKRGEEIIVQGVVWEQGKRT